MSALLAVETEWWIEFSLCLRFEFEKYHQTSMDAGMELNICDGRFFEPMLLKDH